MISSIRLRVSILCLVTLTLVWSADAQAPQRRGRRGAQQQQQATQQPAAAAPAPAPVVPTDKPTIGTALENLRWREIGPANMGGRTDDFAAVESNPSIVFAALASGGVWKTTNGGITWAPVFDKEEVSTIGDIAIAPSDPAIVWVGTGEANNRQSSSWGNGIYKSTDGGGTWTNMGLKETHHIARIVTHPSNTSVVYVAAAGKLWGPSKERGVYKTTDGGKTWTNVLFVNEDTGVIDVAIDLESPDTLYAAAYQRRRTVWGFNGGGPGSAVYKTTDGGATWKKLAKGLPYEQPAAENTGRIGLDVYRRNSNIVYAIIEHRQGGIFRSEDKGETWRKMSDTNPRPMYYSQVHIDPNNDLRIWVLGAPVYFSEDGGRTFAQNRGGRIHGDYHAMWINPTNSDHMIVGTDGGIHWTYDSGRSWDYVNTLAIGQFYEIGLDMRNPYWVCGGLQDNGSWCGPSRTLWQQGITNEEWFRVGGGDGFYAQVDPTDHNILYAESQDGNLLRRDLRTTESKSIRPLESEGEPRFRFQWNSPIVISVHDPKTLYYGGNFLFKSPDRGDSWTKISPDLTTGEDREKKPIMGKLPDRDMLSRHDGVQQWPTITSVGESPVNHDVLWAGTDDGNLQVTRDGGKTWKNVAEKVPGVPKGTYVSRVIASRHAAGTAYATFDGHRLNDFTIYVFMTTDFGETWKDISGNLPRNNGIVNVIREHHRNPKLLFAGTEYGAFYSADGGANWFKFKMNFPTVPVDDIAIHPRENDLVFGTHGRSVWILDDITPLEQLSETVLNSDVHVFDIRPATAWRVYGHKGSTGHKIFMSPNPPFGALVHFYLKAKPAERERVTITIADKSGRTLRTINCGPPPAAPAAGGPGGGGAGLAAATGFQPGLAAPCDPKPGVNRVAWDLRLTSPTADGFGFGGGFGGGGGFGAGAAPMVEPGEYTVKVAITEQGEGGQRQTKAEATKTVKVEEDPRVTISAEDRAARQQAIAQLYEISRTATQATRSIIALRTAVNTAVESWRRPAPGAPGAPGAGAPGGFGAPSIPENVRKAAEDLLKKAGDVCSKFASVQQCGGQAEGLGSAGPAFVQPPPTIPQRIARVFGALNGWTAAPTAWQLEEIGLVRTRLTEASAEVQKLVREDLAALNKLMNEAGIPHIRLQLAGPGGQQLPMNDDEIKP